MINENNDVFTMEDEPIASVMQDMRKGSKWLSAFLENYRPPLDGERYLTDGEVAELLRVSTAKQNVLFLKNEMCIFKEKRNVSSGHSFSLSQTLLKSCLRSV